MLVLGQVISGNVKPLILNSCFCDGANFCKKLVCFSIQFYTDLGVVYVELSF